MFAFEHLGRDDAILEVAYSFDDVIEIQMRHGYLSKLDGLVHGLFGIVHIEDGKIF